MTYTADPGPSRAKVAAVPRKIDLIPPSAYSLRRTSTGPEYDALPPCPDTYRLSAPARVYDSDCGRRRRTCYAGREGKIT